MAEESPRPDDEQPDQDATQPFHRPGAEPDETRPLPPADDIDATRPADAWTGRAEVRGPTPPEDAQDWDEQEPEEPGRRWWLPILLGLLAILLVIGLIALIMALTNNSGGGPTPTVVPTKAAPTSAAPSPSPSPSPPPTSASPPTTATVVVPDTTGNTEAVATGKLTALGLVVRRQEQLDPTATPGTVIATEPTAGTEVPIGSQITLIIAKALPSPPAQSPPPPATNRPSPNESLSPAGAAPQSPHN
jgi:hypothetical protein